MTSRNALSFTEKKVSKNAVMTFVLGIVELVGFFLLIVVSAVTGGKLPLAGGLLGCLFVLLAFFGVFWGVLSYDEAKTNQRFKISGICLNVITIFIGITFVMM